VSLSKKNSDPFCRIVAEIPNDGKSKNSRIGILNMVGASFVGIISKTQGGTCGSVFFDGSVYTFDRDNGEATS
jgi:hypothetical protein